ncbi:MAG TPA: hypothetical protein VGC41_15590 [Kofleriaceae bacterium]
MGAPDTFDVDGFVATLAAVSNSGRTVQAPAFDRGIEEPVPGAIETLPELLTVVGEGNCPFFVQVPDDIRHERLIARHIAFGKSPTDAAAWAHGPDEANARTIAATASRADHTIALDG